MTITLETRCDRRSWPDHEFDWPKLAQDAAEAVATELAVSGQAALLLTGDTRMQDLNRTFRRKDKPTDVLSFPADEMDAPFLGDVAVGSGVSRRDADLQDKSMVAHFQHLVVHGLLHLLGYDHEVEADALEMEELERQILARIGLPDPYSLAEAATRRAT